MPNTIECVICEEDRDPATVDAEGICAHCHDENAEDTAAELRTAGIDPNDSPVVMASEIARRILS